MTDDTSTKGGALVRIKVVATEFTPSDPTYRVNEIGPVQIFEPVLIRVMGVRTTIKVVSRRIFPAFLVSSILWIKISTRGKEVSKDLHDTPPR